MWCISRPGKKFVDYFGPFDTKEKASRFADKLGKDTHVHQIDSSQAEFHLLEMWVIEVPDKENYIGPFGSWDAAHKEAALLEEPCVIHKLQNP